MTIGKTGPVQDHYRKGPRSLCMICHAPSFVDYTLNTNYFARSQLLGHSILLTPCIRRMLPINPTAIGFAGRDAKHEEENHGPASGQYLPQRRTHQAGQTSLKLSRAWVCGAEQAQKGCAQTRCKFDLSRAAPPFRQLWRCNTPSVNADPCAR